MDFSAIIGLVAGVLLIGYGIMNGGVLSSFWDPGSVYITIGGTLAATLISYPISVYKEIPGQMKILIQKKKYDPMKYIEKIVDYAQDARKKGLLALEDKANQEDDFFFKNCIMLIVDAIEPAKAREMLDTELNNLESRHSKGWSFYERVATYAPAYGMIGTLIGLVNMLAAMGTGGESGEAGMASLAGGMSTALITTFYGSVLANLLLVPIAGKLRARHAEEMVCKEMIVEGVLAIQAGNNPRNIEERLKSYLTEKQRKASGSPEEGAAKGGKPAKAPKAKKEK